MRWLPRGSLWQGGGPGQGPGESGCQQEKGVFGYQAAAASSPLQETGGGRGQPQLLSAFMEVGWLESPLQATAAKRRTQQHDPGLSGPLSLLLSCPLLSFSVQVTCFFSWDPSAWHCAKTPGAGSRVHRASHMWRAVNAEKFRRRVSHKECRKAAWRRGPTDSLSYFCDQTLPLLWRATQPPNQKSAPTPCPQGQLRNRTPATVGSPPPGGPDKALT